MKPAVRDVTELGGCDLVQRHALGTPAVQEFPGADFGALHFGQDAGFMPIGRLVDERVIVNAMVALLATGGSTNPPDALGRGRTRRRHPDRLDRLRRNVPSAEQGACSWL